MCLHRPAVFLVCLAALLCVAATAIALTKEDVYYGNIRQYSKVAEVNAKKVFMVIPAYREIIDKNIEKDSALYIIKLNEANKVFREAIAEYAKDNNYDLVCEEGRAEGAKNITDDIVKAIKEKTQK